MDEGAALLKGWVHGSHCQRLAVGAIVKRSGHEIRDVNEIYFKSKRRRGGGDELSWWVEGNGNEH